jgi:hypothetical protein
MSVPATTQFSIGWVKKAGRYHMRRKVLLRSFEAAMARDGELSKQSAMTPRSRIRSEIADRRT